MPPHLHPRSRMTSSLFATTVAASFLVVGLPHILPCPAPRVAYADSEGNRRRPRRRSPQQEEAAEVKEGGIAQFEAPVPVREEGTNNTGAGVGVGAGVRSTITSTAPRSKRECPVPKPGGVIGELIGFKKEERRSTSGPGPETTVDKIQNSNDR
ncbi:hypothetical protein GGR51DRAFT_538032 [Nemania sp. FL0031]|nr:hypothetical protein GGR51DRAFT_538032 [Nemania sp. FL0031]